MPTLYTLDVATEAAARYAVLGLSRASGPFLGRHSVWHGILHARRHAMNLASRDVFAEAPGQRPPAAWPGRQRLPDLFFNEVMPRAGES
jgi:hypothetical protein